MKKWLIYGAYGLLFVIVLGLFVRVCTKDSSVKESYLQNNIECQKMLDKYKIGKEDDYNQFYSETYTDINVIYSPVIDSCIGYYHFNHKSDTRMEDVYMIEDLLGTDKAEFYSDNYKDTENISTTYCLGKSDFRPKKEYKYNDFCFFLDAFRYWENEIKYLKGK